MAGIRELRQRLQEDAQFREEIQDCATNAARLAAVRQAGYQVTAAELRTVPGQEASGQRPLSPASLNEIVGGDDLAPINSQVTDAVTQTNVKVLAEAPAEAMDEPLPPNALDLEEE